MKINALIPARSGSKKLPNKNIIDIGGFPLIAYSIAQAKLSSYISDVVVTTDSEEIAAIARKFGASVPFLRPSEFSKDDSLDIEFFKHYIQYLNDQDHEIPVLIAFLRPTAPFSTTHDTDGAIKYMIDHPEATGLRSMHKSPVTPYKIFKNIDGYAQPFLNYKGAVEFHNYPRQTFEDAYVPNCSVDVVRTDIVVNSNMLYGEKMKIWETECLQDIDTIDDLAIAAKDLQRKDSEHLFDYLHQCPKGS